MIIIVQKSFMTIEFFHLQKAKHFDFKEGKGCLFNNKCINIIKDNKNLRRTALNSLYQCVINYWLPVCFTFTE